jgi:Holliday junction DNA helicase RuvA
VIRFLSGTVVRVDEDSLTLDVSGFGLEVFPSGSLHGMAKIGEPLACAAYLHVSDSGMTLFGFSNESERALFLEITQVKTMGGKLSIALLRHMDVETIVSAILAENPSRLAVPGLGAKRAERICFELKSKIEKKFASFTGGVPASGGRPSLDANVASGLVGLGFSQNEALSAISSCKIEYPDREWTEEALMMSALTKLQRAAGA